MQHTKRRVLPNLSEVRDGAADVAVAKQFFMVRHHCIQSRLTINISSSGSYLTETYYNIFVTWAQIQTHIWTHGRTVSGPIPFTCDGLWRQCQCPCCLYCSKYNENAVHTETTGTTALCCAVLPDISMLPTLWRSTWHHLMYEGNFSVSIENARIALDISVLVENFSAGRVHLRLKVPMRQGYKTKLASKCHFCSKCER